jgi:hypothetical protein
MTPGTISAPPTPENLRLARTVEARMNADSRIVNAKAAFWRMTGVGSLLGLTGLGVAAAIFAYSYVADVKASANQIAAALTDALSKSKLTAEGTVSLDPNARLALADNHLVLSDAKVRIDPNSTVALKDGATVSLRPGGTVGVTGTVQATGNVGVVGNAGTSDGEGIAGIRRAVDQLRTERMGAGAVEYGRNGSKVMNSITTFKTIDYADGQVVTGWNWNSSNDTAPSNQYCYYNQGQDGASIRIELGRDGREVPVTRAPRGFRAQDAAANCIWFGGQRTEKAY